MSPNDEELENERLVKHLEIDQLLGEHDYGVRKGWHPDYQSWRIFHALSFFIGGSTFIAGTVCLFFPGNDVPSAALYTLGSCAFLAVDVQEFFTFSGALLRANIAMSLIGSFLYVVGSLGFFPVVFAWSSSMGVWGFILGSVVIGTSQSFKTYRISVGVTNSSSRFSLRRLINDPDAGTAVGVEAGAGVGAWCFFFGTVLFRHGPVEGPNSVMQVVLCTWVVGSCFFTIGSLFLAYRHFIMHVV